MIVFVAWPTCNVEQSNEMASRWMAAGYKVAVATDLPKQAIRGIKASVPPLLIGKYEGYYNVMNVLLHDLSTLFKADVVVAGGDMILPHPGVKGHDIASAFATRFNNGYGVMLPCANPWKPSAGGGKAQSQGLGYQRRMHATPISSERCEGAWIGKRYILDSNNGNGVFCHKYDQYFGDAELHDVAQREGVLWKNNKIYQERVHWSIPGCPEIRDYQGRNFDRAYEKDYATWRARRYRGYPPTTLILPKQGIVMP